MNIQTIEEQIVAEYGKVKGWVATHAYLSIGIACGVSWGLGRLGFPWFF
jgi:hypothetical protein